MPDNFPNGYQPVASDTLPDLATAAHREAGIARRLADIAAAAADHTAWMVASAMNEPDGRVSAVSHSGHAPMFLIAGQDDQDDRTGLIFSPAVTSGSDQRAAIVGVVLPGSGDKTEVAFWLPIASTGWLSSAERMSSALFTLSDTIAASRDMIGRRVRAGYRQDFWEDGLRDAPALRPLACRAASAVQLTSVAGEFEALLRLSRVPGIADALRALDEDEYPGVPSHLAQRLDIASEALVPLTQIDLQVWRAASLASLIETGVTPDTVAEWRRRHQNRCLLVEAHKTVSPDNQRAQPSGPLPQ